jgi:hypothetical protein
VIEDLGTQAFLERGVDGRDGTVLIVRNEPLVNRMSWSSSASSPRSVAKKARLGTYLPRTARQTVMGVDTTMPSSPQSHVQNIAATRSPRADTPNEYDQTHDWLLSSQNS